MAKLYNQTPHGLSYRLITLLSQVIYLSDKFPALTLITFRQFTKDCLRARQLTFLASYPFFRLFLYPDSFCLLSFTGLVNGD